MVSSRRAQPYRVIAADPPWKFGDSLPGPKRGAARHYDVLSVEQIQRFPIPPIADDAILFLWRVAAMQREALDVCVAWGFEPKSEIVWAKTSSANVTAVFVASGVGLSYGMGRYCRGAHEVCIVARRGRYKVKDAGARSIFFAPRREHSRKPDDFYDIIKRMTGDDGPKLDLFAGEPRKNWTAFGELGRMAKHAEGGR